MRALHVQVTAVIVMHGAFEDPGTERERGRGPADEHTY